MRLESIEEWKKLKKIKHSNKHEDGRFEHTDRGYHTERETEIIDHDGETS